MFPPAGISVGRKKGAAFESAEPSSPKVTCIGQVRVKSKKKKAKNYVARSRSGREASFRRSESAAAASRSRKTVSICDALRSFGSELNCFVPCGWSCSARGEEETAKRSAKRRSSSCGAVFARWLMAIEEGDGEGKGGEIKGREFVGLVVTQKEVDVEVFEKKRVGEEEEEEEEGFYVSPFRSRKEEILVVGKEEGVEEEKDDNEEKGRVGICVPPRNALLLMRCRSDPVRMAALASRFWDSPAMRVQCEEEVVVVSDEESQKVDEVAKEEEQEGVVDEAHVEQASTIVREVEKELVIDEKLEGDEVAVALEEEEQKTVVEYFEVEAENGAEIPGEVVLVEPPEVVEKMEEIVSIDQGREKAAEKGEEEEEEEAILVQRGGDEGDEVEIVLRRSVSCTVPKNNDLSRAKEGGRRRSFSYREKKEKRRHSFSTEMEARRPSFSSEKEARRSSFSVEKDGRRRWSFSIEKENMGPKEKPEAHSWEQMKKEERPPVKEPSKALEAKTTEKIQTHVVAVAAGGEVREKIIVSKKEESQVVEREKKNRELPDCLLLMMYEPKLSMEVSKETWVCSTDFRWRPNYSHPVNQPSKTKGKADDDSSKIEGKCTESRDMVAVTTANTVVAPQTPAKPPPAALSPIEQKLLKSPGIGPLPQHFVLTRCKSEPVKSSARLAPESCFWKSRHQPIGTAGIGF